MQIGQSIRQVISVACLSVGVSHCFAQSTTAPATTVPATQPHVYIPPDQAAVRVDKSGNPDAYFLQKHQDILNKKKNGQIDLIFLGDSITAMWDRVPDVWQSHFGKYHPANFGIGGDRTQNVLWRLDNGELDGLNPKLVVLLIGTNNSITRAEKLAPAIRKIASEIERRLPQTHVLMLGIFPRGYDPADKNDPKTKDVAAIRANLAKTNSLLAASQDERTYFLDVGAIFLDAHGFIQRDIMADGLHPTAKGFEMLADALQPTIDRLMK